MSLLMDALRRAEAEKKAAAKNKSNEESTSELATTDAVDEDEDLGATVKLDRLPLPITGSADAAKEASPNAKPPTVEDITSSIEESLNDLSIDFESTSPRMRSEEVLASASETGNEENSQGKADYPTDTAKDETHDFSIHAEPEVNGEGQALALEPIHDTEITSAEPIPDPITSTTRTLPSANKTDVPNSKDAPSVQLASEAAEKTLAASDVDPLLITTPGESTLETTSGQTAVSANTVFEAGSPGISRRIILWTLTLGIALLALLTVTGLYYFQQAPTARPLPSPIASVELERARLKEAQSISRETPETTGSVAQANTEQMATIENDQVLVEKQSVQASHEAANAVISTENTEQGGSLSAQSSVEESTHGRADDDASSTPAQNATQAIAKTYRNTPTIDTKRLSIARSMRGVRSNEHVMAGYEAYQAGDLAAAKELYKKALAIRPQDINALNGMAALALGESDSEQAHQLYSRVLKLEPNNPTATAALFQIEGGVGNRVTETQLKMMLDNDGDPGLINFALGNLYSRHNRWNDAQLAFFEAVRHRPNNPDYLFNLAVSLDQIGQRKAAKDYYQKAVTAADETSAGFNAADAIARIQSINQSASASAP